MKNVISIVFEIL